MPRSFAAPNNENYTEEKNLKVMTRKSHENEDNRDIKHNEKGKKSDDKMGERRRRVCIIEIVFCVITARV